MLERRFAYAYGLASDPGGGPLSCGLSLAMHWTGRCRKSSACSSMASQPGPVSKVRTCDHCEKGACKSPWGNSRVNGATSRNQVRGGLTSARLVG